MKTNMEALARLSFYEDLTTIGGRDNVFLVKNRETQKIYVKKILTEYKKHIYELISEKSPKYFPRIYEIIEEHNTLYLIEEYVMGDTLEEYFQTNGSMEIHEAKVVMKDICNALLFLHRQDVPIIHRDIKPSNIMRDKDGIWKIIDLNTARNYIEDADYDTEYLGTKGFAAPEQYGFKQTDVRTDIYALGLILNYMLTGKSPVQRLCSGDVGKIVQKCIQFEPGERYQSVEELYHALVKIQEFLPTEKTQIYKLDDTTEKKKTETKKEKTSKIKIERSKKEQRFPWLPPGFRTLTPWKMIVGAVGYVLLLWSCFTTTLNGSNGQPMLGIELLANRIAIIIWGILIILISCNYMGIHRRLPLLKSQKLGIKILGCVCYSFIILTIDVIILVAIFP